MSKYTTSKSIVPKIIGEGTYGCAHKPALLCTRRSQGDRKINYNKSISKLGDATELTEEANKYLFLDKIDPEFKYHLKDTFLCDPDLNKNEMAIADCNIGFDVLEEIDKYKIIIMRDGGSDLNIWIDRIMKGQVDNSIVYKIWRQCGLLLQGVQLFLNHDLVHHDIKTGNIVYNDVYDELRFIDFGLAESIMKEKYYCANNNYSSLAINFFYYPFESIFLEKENFDQIKQLVNSENANENLHLFIADRTRNIKENNYWLTRLKMFINFKDNIAWENFWYKQLSGLYVFMLGYLKECTYEEFLDLYFRKIDVYCLGIAFYIFYNHTMQFLDDSIRSPLENLILEMVNFNLKERIEVNDAIARFRNIMGDFQPMANPIHTHKKNSKTTGGSMMDPIVDDVRNAYVRTGPFLPPGINLRPTSSKSKKSSRRRTRSSTKKNSLSKNSRRKTRSRQFTL